MEKLISSKKFSGPRGPVVLTIMDGVGIGKYEEGDMVRRANTPALDWLLTHAVSTRLIAHGTAVGMPSDSDMGNSEIGHNAIGCGRVFEQGASLINKAIESRDIFNGAVWKELIENVIHHNSKLHFIGLLSDGNVHSHIEHLEALLTEAKAEGVKTARIHILLDGRDVRPTSALEYVDRLENFLSALRKESNIDFEIASGGGRMKITMDRYQADWGMVELGWKTHVKGEGRKFKSAREAIETLRRENPGVIDQDLPPFVIARNHSAIGPIVDGDSVIFFNFRGDRAIEISQAFESETFDKFPRGPKPKVKYAGMMQYDGDALVPSKYLVSPPGIDRTLGEYLVKAGIKQLAISETQKFGHVTYFFNGNRTGKFDENLEDYIEVPSDMVPFEQRPWMKAAEITDKVVEAVKNGRYRFIRLNYANGDMVGHTGVFDAVEIAVEAVDLCIARLLEAVKETDGILVVSADHGNSDDMYERNKKTREINIDPETGKPKPKTSHSLNPVPACVYDPSGTADVRLSGHKDLGISSLAATCLKLLGFERPEDYTPSIVEVG
ncbi:MAG: 2,3-bisphosphoglycerate-independent phosphoglycerate mutase [Deltaproteobacteria bacterium]|nr:2,3-bisphosphoglycerate-independent phosphoglycerate mutase [Deltaproteobacteria bacterium]MBW1993627.1 2,3-bisphosphoglycerate-independent phosphoglycerate mutase [Deltaproteobacteria bacterium]MBW2150313.1 2,3-bisphosphoglycerate-independent phosphoglycerate mutase [Deltaproteobacteria bacterium]